MKPSLSIAALFFLLLSLSIQSCKPEKVKPTEPVKEPSKFELIPGRYKIYDTVGTYLYEMEIQYKKGYTTNGIVSDSFTYINLDNRYNFTVYQSTANVINLPKYYFDLWTFDPLIDHDGHRTFFFGLNCHYSNDSIYMNFEKNNVKYYLSDMVPYYRYDSKQIGVKQH